MLLKNLYLEQRLSILAKSHFFPKIMAFAYGH